MVRTRVGDWCSLTFSAKTLLTANFDLDIAGDYIVSGFGTKVTLGPIYTAPGDIVNVVVANGQPSSQVTGTLWGIYAPTGEELEINPGAPQISGIILSTVSGEVVGTDFKATGLAGAQASSRYAGATTGGPPLTGVFGVGDWVPDNLGNVWVLVALPSSSAANWRRTDGWFGLGSGLPRIGAGGNLNSRILLQSDSFVGSTDANGDLTIGFANSFPNGWFTVLPTIGDKGVGGSVVRNPGGANNVAGFTVRVYTAYSTPYVGLTRIDYLAIGW